MYTAHQGITRSEHALAVWIVSHLNKPAKKGFDRKDDFWKVGISSICHQECIEKEYKFPCSLAVLEAMEGVIAHE